MAQPLPSAAASAGAAAATLLQQQLAKDTGGSGAGPAAASRNGSQPEVGWTEHQTGDGRKFFFHEESQTSIWEKPEALMTPEERTNDTKWREYRIWDGRVFYHNKETKVSCWSAPPELRKLRGDAAMEEAPLPLTHAEKRRAFIDLLHEKGVGEGWNWRGVDEATRGSEQAQGLDEAARKQCFAELLSLSMKQKQIQDREKERNAARALERLFEERFGKPENVNATYEDAKRLLSGEEPWGLIKSDVRRDELFQNVMERLEEKHRKTRAEQRAERVVRLQRLMGSDPELTRTRLRWKDATAVLLCRDELVEEEPPLEALRVWASLRNLRTATEHEAEQKAKVVAKEDASVYRAERKRREDFAALVKDAATRGAVAPGTPWAQFAAEHEGEPRYTALRDGQGAAPQEIYDEVLEELRLSGVEAPVGVGADKVVAPAPPPAKRRRRAFSAEEPQAFLVPKEEEGLNKATSAGGAGLAPAVSAPAAEGGAIKEEAMGNQDDMNALDALINAANLTQGPPQDSNGAPPLLKPVAKVEEATQQLAAKAELEDEEEEEEEEDPLTAVVARAAAEKAERAAAAAAAAAAGGAS